MNRFITAATALTATLAMQASATMPLQGVDFKVDTLAHYYIGPGVTQTSLVYKNGTRTIRAYAITLDMDESAGRAFAKVDVGRDSCNTGEAISSIAKRKTTDTRQYLAGINGDFFITSAFASQHELGNAILGYPNMSCATGSKMVAPDMIDVTSRENALILCNDGNMYIDETALKYRVLNNSGDIVIDAKAINYPRRANELMLYNSYMGGYTKTDAMGRELVLRLADGASWAINKAVKFVVDSDWRQGGNSRIPADGLVISMGPSYTASAANLDFLNNLKVGDVVKLKLECTLPAFGSINPDIREILGGDVRILKENVTTTSAIRWINTPSAQYGRALVGYTQDRKRLIICTVDHGGGTGSSGVTYYEAADLMRNLGCWDALDLDGGGSTAMWSHSHGIVNKLRDGAERAVGNGFFFVMDAPKDNAVASIRFANHALTLPRYGTFEPVIFGYNKYGQLVDKDVKGFVLEAPSALGTVSDDGTALLADGGGTHALTVRLGEMSATMPVTVDAAGVVVPRIQSVLLDDKTQWPVELQAEVAGAMMKVAPQAFSWTSADDAVATISADGIVTPVADGTTTVTGRVGDAEVSVNVTVEVPKAPEQPIESGDFDFATWKVSQTSIDKNSVTATPGANGSFDLGFNVTSVRSPKLTLGKDIRLWSHPDKILVDINPKDATITKVAVDVIPANATRAVSVTVTPTLTANAPNRIEIPVSEFCDPADVASYPLTFSKISFYPGAKTGAVVFTVNGLKAVYGSVGGVQDIIADAGDCDGLCDVYTLTGICVARNSSVESWSAGLQPGLYLVRTHGKGVTKHIVR